MPKYLIQATYTLDGIKAVKANGGSARRAAIDDAMRSFGGMLESFYFALGDADVYAIADFPGIIDAAAMSLAVCAAGGARTKTVVLLTPEEIDLAAQREVGYQPPEAS
ncbi:MAG TPA: GYD domain-containing protein [Acidimicrobiales bacterium]|nr:GYD domain-containing protein [Acidimicrobiales bacterium]